MFRLIVYFMFFCLSFYSLSSSAEISHKLYRRIVIFPFHSVAKFNSSANDAWWKARQEFTRSKKFLVASKNFMERKDVFQPRGVLKPADAIILGELLDANLIITGKIEGRSLQIFAYEVERGQLVWEKESKFSPSQPIKEQISMVTELSIQLFIAILPYHGFVVTDDIIGKPVYQESGKFHVNLFVGLFSKLNVGDVVQWVNLYSQNLKPLFQGGSSVEVFAEGEVVTLGNDGVIVAKVNRVTNIKNITEFSLVRFPSEMKRVKELYALKDSIKRNVNPDYFSKEIVDVNRETEETKPLVTSLSFLVNIATMLLLAF